MKTQWFRDVPSKEGFYFWKRSRRISDQFHYKVYGFFETDEPGKITCWDSESEVHAPNGGWWKGPLK